MTTYVYGSPHGFNFYEGDTALDYYFKAFYISSRQGRRLMVNRRDDGTTIYSFLCYGLAESTKRPNAFFGMSVVSDGAEYCPDMKELYEWFDYLFGKLVERGGVFRVLDDGKLQYRIDKFKDAEDDIEWLKGNLPNIFTKASGVVMLSYDRSYAWGNTGHVICCNIDTDPDRIIADFKRSQWIALSPDFAPEEEREEINFAGLEDKLNRYNQSLLSVAVNPSAASLSQLSAAEADCTDTLIMLRKYLKVTIDDEERQQCQEIYDKYSRLYDNIAALIGRIEADKRRQEIQRAALRSDNRTSLPHTDKRTVSQSDKRKVSQPTQKDTLKTVGKAGGFFRRKSRHEEDMHPRKPDSHTDYRRCRECHERKLLSEFNVYVDVCDACASKTKPKKESWWKRIDPLYASFVILLVIIIISTILILKGCNSGREVVKADGKDTTKVEVVEESVKDPDTVSTNNISLTAEGAASDNVGRSPGATGIDTAQDVVLAVAVNECEDNTTVPKGPYRNETRADKTFEMPEGKFAVLSTKSPNEIVSPIGGIGRPNGGGYNRVRYEVTPGSVTFTVNDGKRSIQITIKGVKKQQKVTLDGISQGKVDTSIGQQSIEAKDTMAIK